MVTRVGILISGDRHYTNELCRGAYEACLEFNLELVICYGGMIDSECSNPEIQQKMLAYQFIDEMNLDMILIPINSIFMNENNLKKQFVDSFQTPVIILNEKIEGYSFVMHNHDSFYQAIEYMIVHGQRQHIGIITGHLENRGSIERLHAYKKALTKHHLDIKDDYILDVHSYSNFNMETIKQWLYDHPEFDGIVCANDTIALSIYPYLQSMNKKIGEDILVCGFDDVPTALQVMPALSSCHAAPSMLAYLAIHNGLSQLKTQQTFEQYVDTYFIPRLSIGYDSTLENELRQFLSYCYEIEETPMYLAEGITNFIFENKLVHFKNIKNLFIQLFYKLIVLSVIEMNNSYALHEIDNYLKKIFTPDFIQLLDLEKLLVALSIFIDFENERKGNGVIHFYKKLYSHIILCYNKCIYQQIANKKDEIMSIDTMSQMAMHHHLHQNNQLIQSLEKLSIRNAQLYLFEHPVKSPDDLSFQIPKELIWELNIENGQMIPTHHCYIKTKDILSTQSLNARVMTNVHFNDIHYGLFVCEIDLNKISYIDFIANQFAISISLNSMLSQLNTRALTDELTHLYNRRGVYDQLEFLQNNKKKHDIFYLLLGDIDSLKYINDTFGHEAGDQAILLASQILKEAFKNDAIIARLGGDEFIVVFKTDNISFIKDFDCYFKNIEESLNDSVDYPFYVSLSYGISVFDILTKNVDIAQLITYADRLMYEKKREKKRFKEHLLNKDSL